MAPNGCVKKHLKGLGTVGTVRFRLDSVAKCIINLKKNKPGMVIRGHWPTFAEIVISLSYKIKFGKLSVLKKLVL